MAEPNNDLRAYRLLKELNDEKRANGIDAAMSLALTKYDIEDKPERGRESIRELLLAIKP